MRRCTSGGIPTPVSPTSIHAQASSWPAAHGDGSALGDGLGGIDQQVHHHLVDLRRQARRATPGRNRAPPRPCTSLVPHHVEGAFDAGVEVGLLPFGLIDPREVLQVGHDLAHPVEPSRDSPSGSGMSSFR